MSHFLTLKPNKDVESEQIAYVRDGKKGYKIFLAFSRDGKGYQRLLIPDEFITKHDNYEQGIFPFFKNNTEQNHRLMVVGSSGSGKSQWISQALEQMSKKLKKTDQDDEDVLNIGEKIHDQIIIFSTVKHDKALDKTFSGKQPIRVDFRSQSLDDLSSDQFINCILIFDDVEQFAGDKKIKEKILKLRGECFEKSRHEKTDLISVSHKAMVGSLNTIVKNESTGIVIFPFHSNQYRELHKFLSSYLGYTDKNLLKYMLTTLGKKYYKTRYVYIAKKNPNILIHRNGVEIIPDEYGFEDINYANIPLIP